MRTRVLERLVMASLTAAVLAFPQPAHGDETTFCNFFITSVPYVITAQGHYCFNRNLSTAITSGNAITIDSDFVVLDLNNFKLGGAGAATLTNGVYALNHRNITIRNGNIRGFYRGIFLDDNSGTGTTGGSYTIENIVADQNTLNGIAFSGTGSVIRHNQIVSNGGTPNNPGDYASGIYFIAWSGAQIIDNTISDVRIAMGGGGMGIQAFGESAIVERNAIANASVTGNTIGIEVAHSALVVDNRAIAMAIGVNVESFAEAGYRDNATVGCTAGVNAGIGNFDYGNNQ